MAWVQEKLNIHLIKRGVRKETIAGLLPLHGHLRAYNGVYNPVARMSVLFCLDYSHVKDGLRARVALGAEGFSHIEVAKEGCKLMVWPNDDSHATPKSTFLLTLQAEEK